MDNNISIITAFFAGILSFVSPCVLPLLSSYLVFISGNAANTVNTAEKKSFFSANLMASTLFFVFGFSFVFIVLSLLISGFVFFLGGLNKILNIIAGSIVMLLGLNILFNFMPFLKYDDSSDRCETCTPEHSILSASSTSILHPSKRPKGFLGSFIVGAAFGAGWTPCVGAFLGSILLMAGQSGQMGLSALYLAAYSAGLGLPFIIASLFWHKFINYIAKIKRVMPVIRIISGVFLVLIGLLMVSSRFFWINAFFQKTGSALSAWAYSYSLSVRLIPALVFAAIALLPLIVRLLRKKKPVSCGLIVWLCIFLALACLNGAGLINSMQVLAGWFSFSGI